MLPTSTNELPSNTIHINPNFRSATMLQQLSQQHQGHTIHINPNFLQKKLLEQEELLRLTNARQVEIRQQQLRLTQSTEAARIPSIKTPIQPLAPKCKIISKTRMRLVREPLMSKTAVAAAERPQLKLVQGPIITLNKRKLVRSAATPQGITATQNDTASTASVTVSSPAAPTKNANVVVAKYKIDRRKILLTPKSPLVKVRRRLAYVARYALRRATEHVINKKPIVKSVTTHIKPATILFKRGSGGSQSSVNKTLQLLNINGVLYKSTRNKLQRKLSNSNSSATSPTSSKCAANNNKTPKTKFVTSTQVLQARTSISGRTLFVRGTKYIMDPQGFKLTRMPGHNVIVRPNQMAASKKQRIDIGGLTYVALKTQNVLIRTNNHVARAHLLTARQRSLQLLTSRLVKSNIPCAIFQRLGKCAAYTRGKCRKLHDKRQVSICPRFLRGECNDSECLLSHNVSLAKMPVCKFFLQGVCVRSDCPYLHKKLNQKTEICVDFLRGFCLLAEQCNKRHEFRCPEFERSGKCTTTNCAYCKMMNRRQQQRLQGKQLQKASVVHIHLNEPKKLTNNEEAEGNDAAAVSAGDNVLQSASRYFDGNMEITGKTLNASDDDVNSDSDDSDEDLGAEKLPQRRARPKIGALPAYIPLS